MSIKYGELTIIYNKEQNIFTNLLIWLKYREKPPNNSKYIFLFDDGEICDSDDKFKDFHFKFCNTVLSVMPLYFEKTIKNIDSLNNTYFYKKPIQKDKKMVLDFNELFSLYSKYNKCLNIESSYNSIYYCHKNLSKPEIFGLLHTKSNEYMPRFQFAYDSDEFTKEEIVYLIHHIFNSLDLQNE
jgi:hypothetical protein